VLYFGTDDQKKRFLPRIVEGEIAAFALTEPDAGSDAAGVKTVAERKDGGVYSLKGQKTYITNGGVASIYTVFASTDKSRGPRGVSGFVFDVDPKKPGDRLIFPTKFDKMGINASETREVVFDGFEIPKENLIGGKEGRGFLHAMGTFDATRPMIGIIGVGIARAALEEALKYTHERIQFGVPVIQFRGLQEMFVDMTVTVESARALCLKVSRRLDDQSKQQDITGLSGIAKVAGSEAGRITLDALQATGGYGYMNETPFPKLVRDFKIFEIFEGSNQIQREQISLQLVKEFGKGGWADSEIEEAEGAHARSPHCGAKASADFRRTFSAYLERLLARGEENIASDQYFRFILADVLIDLETAHAYSIAVSRIEENDSKDFSNCCARISSAEACLRNASRLKRLVLGTCGSDALDSLEKETPLAALERHACSLLEDRRILGAQLAENRG
jgi:alkylation response protein AidB-like acyl-CoA dehydrogenase